MRLLPFTSLILDCSGGALGTGGRWDCTLGLSDGDGQGQRVIFELCHQRLGVMHARESGDLSLACDLALDGGAFDHVAIERDGEILTNMLPGVLGKLLPVWLREGERYDGRIHLRIGGGAERVGVELHAGEDYGVLAGGTGSGTELRRDVCAGGDGSAWGIDDVELTTRA